MQRLKALVVTPVHAPLVEGLRGLCKCLPALNTVDKGLFHSNCVKQRKHGCRPRALVVGGVPGRVAPGMLAVTAAVSISETLSVSPRAS